MSDSKRPQRVHRVAPTSHESDLGVSRYLAAESGRLPRIYFRRPVSSCGRNFDEFTPGTNFLAWALRIADRKVMNFRTTQSRYAAFNAGLRDALMTEFAGRKAEDTDDGLATLAGCMQRLPSGDQQLVTLCYAEGESVPKVADTMGRSSESVYHSLRRIRNALLDCIRRQSRHAEMPASLQRGSLDEGNA